jgi:hypothetical protein
VHIRYVHATLTQYIDIESPQSYRHKEVYTFDDFVERVDVLPLLKSFVIGSIFGRGLPLDEHIQEVEIAEVFQEVLRYGSILIVDRGDDTPYPEHLKRCVRNGWLYNIATGAGRFEYVFASPLHKRYVEWMMRGSPQAGIVHDTSLSDFTMAVIRKFSSLNLDTPRKFGNTTQTVPEAQFQDEFYRACAHHTQGDVVSFPEFGTKRGRVDFFIPSKKWGVELLCNGDRINAHSERFTEGEYGKWIKQGKMTDYIVVDFRMKRSRAKCDGKWATT